jgi:DMSO/TMAO reductase YedYZ molybdopterin-dependent catalytic subunit
MLSLVFGFGGFVTPGVASAADISVTITGDGVANPITFSQANLEAMKQYRHVYSTINTWPTKKLYIAEGPKLSDLLEIAGIKDEATLIKFKSTDGFTKTLTREQLDAPRYYYPGLKENHEYFGYIPGSPEGAVQVDTILALKSVEGSDDPNHMSDRTAPLLVMGQRWITEQTNELFVKTVKTIEVFKTPPEKWENPKANPEGGTVPVGTKVELSTSNMDGDNIHYTADGSDPTIRSPIYNWVKKRWWSSRSDELLEINKPIEINQDTVIKAVAIGAGKEDSDIVVFDYQVLLDEAPILTPDVTDNVVGKSIEITFEDDEAWRDAITEVIVNDTTLIRDEEYSVSAGKLTINASVFTTAGDYTVVVKALGYQDVTIIQQIEEAPVFIVDGNAVTEAYYYTMAGLKAMDPTTDIYTSKSGDITCTGVALADLLAALDITDDSWQVQIHTTDAATYPVDPVKVSDLLDPENKYLLTYEIDDQPITGDATPLRIYWSGKVIKNVTGITVTKPDFVDPPVLVADTTDNTVGNSVEITFEDNEAWRDAITEIVVNDIVLENDKYSVETGKLIIDASVFTEAGIYTIVVKATGYSDAAVEQQINKESVQPEPEKPQYNVIPKEGSVYTIGVTADGIKTLTVNPNQTGFKYFTVSIEPVKENEGTETAVFTHLRDNIQLQLNASVADFDVVKAAKAGFNVEPDDVIKVYIVDRLSNDSTSNPVIFQ